MRYVSQRRLIVLVTLLSVILGCNNKGSENPFPANKTLELEVSVDSFPTVDLPDSVQVYLPSDLEVDSAGNVYIVDEGTGEIKVFSNKGNPLTKFGGRGRGPGEFNTVSGFALYRDSLYVYDHHLYRMNVFSLDGETTTTHSMEVAAPIILKPLDNGRHLAVFYDDFSQTNSETNFGQVYSPNFVPRDSAFLNIDQLAPGLSDVTEVLAFNPGSVLKTGAGSFIFVPFFYDGKLYEFVENDSGQWVNENTYKGYTERRPFTFLENSSDRHPDVTLELAGREQPQEYVIHNQSKGLLKHNNRIYHFTQCEFDDGRDERVFGVEIYNDQMEPLGYLPFKRIPIVNEKGNTIGWKAKGIDNQGRVYFIERNLGTKEVKVLTFKQALN